MTAEQQNQIIELLYNAQKGIDEAMNLLRGATRLPDTFLEEINQPVKLASDEPEPTPDIPAPKDLPEQVDENLANKEVLIEKFGLEEIAQSIDPKIWESLVKTFVIAGWNMRMLLDSNWWKKQTITLTAKEAERLDELSLLRDQMILKEMDLAQVQGQNGMTEIEKLAFAELVKKENLK